MRCGKVTEILLLFANPTQFYKMDPVLASMIAESQREAQEKADKIRVIQEIINLRKRLGLGKEHLYMFDVQL